MTDEKQDFSVCEWISNAARDRYGGLLELYKSPLCSADAVLAFARKISAMTPPPRLPVGDVIQNLALTILKESNSSYPIDYRRIASRVSGKRPSLEVTQLRGEPAAGHRDECYSLSFILTDEETALISMRYVEGQKWRTIADCFGTSVAKVKHACQVAKAKIEAATEPGLPNDSKGETIAT